MEALVQNCDMFYPFSLLCGFRRGGFGATLISYPESYLEFFFYKNRTT